MNKANTKPQFKYKLVSEDGKEKTLLSDKPLTSEITSEHLHIDQILDTINQLSKDNETINSRNTLLEAVFDTITDGIVVADTERKITNINTGMEDIFGYNIEDIKGKTTSVLYESEEEYLKQGKIRFNLSSEEAAKRYEVNYRRKNGEVFVGETLGTKIITPDGTILGFIGQIRDISELLAMQKELIRSKRRFTDVLENSRDMSYKYNLVTKKYDYISAGALNVVGFTSEECMEMDLSDVKARFHPDDFSKYIESFKQLVSAKQDDIVNPIIEYRWCHKDGDYHWYSDNRSTIFNKKGNAIAIVGSQRDISDIKKSEDRLKKTEEELLKIQELENIGILAGGIAHDFNNILTGIFGNIFLAKNSLPEDAPALKYLQKSESSIDRATRLTAQLLTFSKGGEPIKTDTDIIELIKEIVSFDLTGSNVKPKYDFPEKIIANIDKNQFQQLLSNLVINADQAMPDGGQLKISASIQNGSADQSDPTNPAKYLHIRIKDNGRGIDEAIIKKIFDPYFSTKEDGSGLGLSTVYSIIKKHGGDIRVHSELGIGTIFNLYVPLSENQQQDDISVKEINITAKHNKILIMDDDEMIQSLVSSILEINDFEPESAVDGSIAVEMYQQALHENNPYSAVIMDLTIPGGMGGKETVLKILEIDPQAKCIVSSGYADDPIMANFKDYGFAGMITKPFVLDDLIAAIKNVIN